MLYEMLLHYSRCLGIGDICLCNVNNNKNSLLLSVVFGVVLSFVDSSILSTFDCAFTSTTCND